MLRLVFAIVFLFSALGLIAYFTRKRIQIGGLIAFAVLLFALALSFSTAFAADATIPTAPLVDLLTPYINVIVQAAVTALLAWAALEFKKWTGLQLSSDIVGRLTAAAQTEAGVLVAAAADNLRGRSITVGSPTVASAATRIEARLPDLVKAAGLTTDALQHLVAGEVGKLQAVTPHATAPAVAAPSTFQPARNS